MERANARTQKAVERSSTAAGFGPKERKEVDVQLSSPDPRVALAGIKRLIKFNEDALGKAKLMGEKMVYQNALRSLDSRAAALQSRIDDEKVREKKDAKEGDRAAELRKSLPPLESELIAMGLPEEDIQRGREAHLSGATRPQAIAAATARRDEQVRLQAEAKTRKTLEDAAAEREADADSFARLVKDARDTLRRKPSGVGAITGRDPGDRLTSAELRRLEEIEAEIRSGALSRSDGIAEMKSMQDLVARGAAAAVEGGIGETADQRKKDARAQKEKGEKKKADAEKASSALVKRATELADKEMRAIESADNDEPITDDELGAAAVKTMNTWDAENSNASPEERERAMRAIMARLGLD